MKQMTLAATGFERYGKTTRREVFLSEMERVVPWATLCALIEPVYPKPGKGRPPVGVEQMLRIYFLQHWFNLSDPAAEEALYDSAAMRGFVGIDLGREPAPNAMDFTDRRYRHRGVVDEVARARNRTRSKVRAEVEHAIGVVKRVFGFVKVRYRGFDKNARRLFVTCALANLFMVRHHLMRAQGM